MRTTHDLDQRAARIGGPAFSKIARRGPTAAWRFARPTSKAWVSRCGWSPIHPLYRPTKGGAAGAGKIIGTDYSLAGPGQATRKTVGRGGPRTPSTQEGIE